MVKRAKRPREDWFYPSQNFGALPPPQSGADTSGFVLLPVPYEASTTYRAGCRQGPGAIIEASTNMELYDEELGFEPSEAGIHTSPPLDVVDDPGEMVERIRCVATGYLEKGKFVTLLGGEHTVSLGMVMALSALHDDLSVLYLDAHADFRQSYHGNKLNHACVARRISENCRLTQAGTRSLSREESDDLGKKASTFWAREFVDSRTKGRETLVERVLSSLERKVYVSIDADVFDPSIMPAVGAPEPGGLLWEDVVSLLAEVARARTLVGLDLVELAPVAGMVHPEFMAARLVYKIWGYVLRTQRGADTTQNRR